MFLWLGVWAVSALANLIAAMGDFPGLGGFSFFTATGAIIAAFIHVGLAGRAFFNTNFQPPSNSQTCPSSESTPNPKAAAEILSTKCCQGRGLFDFVTSLFGASPAEIESRLQRLEAYEKAKA